MTKLRVALDSGAFSVYNQKFSPSKKGMESDKDKANYDYADSPDFIKFLDDYTEYCLEHSAKLDMYVTMDVIYNAKASWKTFKYMVGCGANPVPVFHYGEPWRYLERYLDNYEYVGVGGLGQRTSVQAYIEFGDEIFKRVCDKHGRPRNKMHGFAMTSVQLMRRYPWYSCDSSTWTSLSRNGWARFPRIDKQGNYDWMQKPIAWRFTDGASHTPVHISKQSDLAVMYMEKYLADTFGFSIADVSQHTYFWRDVVNAGHTYLLSEALKKYYKEKWDYEEGANIYLAGHTGDRMTVREVKRQVNHARRPLPENVPARFLGSFYYPIQAEVLFEAMKPSVRRELI